MTLRKLRMRQRPQHPLFLIPRNASIFIVWRIILIICMLLLLSSNIHLIVCSTGNASTSIPITVSQRISRTQQYSLTLQYVMYLKSFERILNFESTYTLHQSLLVLRTTHSTGSSPTKRESIIPPTPTPVLGRPRPHQGSLSVRILSRSSSLHAHHIHTSRRLLELHHFRHPRIVLHLHLQC
jgi:hypothetical protein